MLNTGRLVTSLRYRLNDMQGVRYSDFELIEAVNRAAGLLFGRLSARFVWAASKKTVIIVDEEAGSALLPRDFHNMRRVTREAEGTVNPGRGTADYRVVGQEFYAAPGAYGLEYWYLPRPVFGMDDELDAPEAVSPWLETVALAVLKDDMSGAETVCEECCRTLAGGEASRFPEHGVAQIIGGVL